MAIPYHHTQFAPLVIGAMIVFALICFAGARAVSVALVRWSIAPVGLVLIACAVIFGALTIDVGQSEVTWHFGPGLWTYKLPRSEIRSVAIVRNSWKNGWGIRVGPRFRLYNIQGLDAVELRLKDGTVNRLGTDEAPALAAALEQ